MCFMMIQLLTKCKIKWPNSLGNRQQFWFQLELWQTLLDLCLIVDQKETPPLSVISPTSITGKEEILLLLVELCHKQSKISQMVPSTSMKLISSAGMQIHILLLTELLHLKAPITSVTEESYKWITLEKLKN